MDVLVASRVAGIHHVQQQMRFARLLQCRLKRGHEFVRQLADEAHGVRQHHRRAARKTQAAHGWIEGGEQLVRDIDLAAGKRIEQRRFTGVGVADQRHRRHRNLRARTAPSVALPLEALEPVCDRAHARAEQTPVGLQLCFPGAAAHADTALLPFEMGPAAHQATRLVLQLRQLDFEFALETARPSRKYIQDQPATIEHAYAGQALEVALLARRQRVIEQDQFGTLGARRTGDFLCLAAADEVA